MMRKTIQLLALFSLLSACNGNRVSERLNHVDSLIVKEQYDSASILLSEVAEASKTAEEQAHYYLLETQVGYLINHPLPSDSLLDMAIQYYNKVRNHQKLADTYYYKSIRYKHNQDYPQAILYGKKAEHFSVNTNNVRLQFKVAENLAYLNGLCENDNLQLQYARKALALAQKVQNKNWMAYSYNKISLAFYNLGQYDSAFAYVEKSIPYMDYVAEADRAAFLMNIGVLYKENDKEKAKAYFERSLTYGELPEAFEHLADVYYAEGDRENAYQLWKKALATDGRYEKGNLIHSILSYNLESGNLDEASRNVDEIVAIKDSIITMLRNDTLKDLQLRFDHEVAIHETDKKLINIQWLLLAMVLITAVMAFYIYTRRQKEKITQKEYQMQLYAYTMEINQLKDNKEKALAQIRELESRKVKDSQRISELEEDAQNAEVAIEKLNKNIRRLLDNKAPKLNQGRMLYDHIINGGNVNKWSSKEEGLFVDYYAAVNYQAYNRLKKVKRETRTNAHNMFYLILKEMGYSDEEIRRIMVLTHEGLRSIRKRTSPIG